jgi:hypothetical protein
MWIDGICKKCGSIVLETGISDFDQSDEDISNCDYKNRCTNTKCCEYKWHYVGDQEELDYYYHNPRLEENEKFKSVLKEILGTKK